MHSSISNSNVATARIPWAAMLAVALTLVLQVASPHSRALWRFLFHYSNPGNDDGLRLEAQFRLTELVPGQKLVILTGSSVTREGFDADAMNQVLAADGIRVINLGTTGGQPLDMYLLASRYSSLKPALILHMGYVRCFYKVTHGYAKFPLSYNGYGLRELLAHAPRRDLWKAKAYLRDALIGQLLPWYRHRDSVHGILLTEYPTAWMAGTRGQVARRYILEDMHDPLPEGALDNQIREAQGKAYQVSPYTDMEKYFFREYLAAVRRNGIRMVVVDAPSHPRFHEMYPEVLNAAFRETVQAATAAAGVRYVHRESLPPFGPQDFYDLVHTISPGRAKLSEFGIELIRQELLPVSREPPPNP